LKPGALPMVCIWYWSACDNDGRKQIIRRSLSAFWNKSESRNRELSREGVLQARRKVMKLLTLAAVPARTPRLAHRYEFDALFAVIFGRQAGTSYDGLARRLALI
jgi:hypothetical protein